MIGAKRPFLLTAAASRLGSFGCQQSLHTPPPTAASAKKGVAPLRYDCKKKTHHALFLSAFPMIVPSLSW